MGETLRFELSHALFSSFDIDAGTKLLLKTIAQQGLIKGNETILDAGCGVGTIAVCIKKKFPNTVLTAIDRDALAVEYTKENARLNKIDNGLNASAGLLPGGLKAPLSGTLKKYDLIISNIPAKAGEPVIKDFLTNSNLHIKKNGKLAIVIVNTLSNLAKDCLIKSGAKILFTESDKNYSVFHFIPGKKNKNYSFNEIYKRTNGAVCGYFGLAEFDTISYRTKTVLEMIDIHKPANLSLFWNPGIGYIPKRCINAKKIILAGFDWLELNAAKNNLNKELQLLHLPSFKEIKNHLHRLDTIIAIPRFIPKIDIESEIIDTSLELLKPGGHLIVSGKSSDMAKIERVKKSFSLKHSIKFRGFRTILLVKRR